MEIFDNIILWSAVAAWISAQIIKFVIGIIKTHRIDFLLLYSSGRMPSSHSATVCALAASTGLVCGFGSPAFAIAVILAFVVMYDACGVRRAAGEQARILNRVVSEIEAGRYVDFNTHLKEYLGHTKKEVFAGALLGILTAAAAYAIKYGSEV